jgi:hypothetical protein
LLVIDSRSTDAIGIEAQEAEATVVKHDKKGAKRGAEDWFSRKYIAAAKITS